MYVLDYQQLTQSDSGLTMKLLVGITKVITDRLRSVDDKVVNAVMWGTQTTTAEGQQKEKGDVMSIKGLINESQDVKVTFPDGELLGKIKDIHLNEASLPDLVLSDSTGHHFLIPYHSVKYIIKLEKKKSTSRFL